MIFPIKQQVSITLKSHLERSSETYLNLIEDVMMDSGLVKRKRTSTSVMYVKADLLKYPHPRNVLHNVTFHVERANEIVQIRISTLNWELIMFVVIGAAVILKKELIGWSTLIIILTVFSLLLGMKQHLLNTMKTSLLCVLRDI